MLYDKAMGFAANQYRTVLGNQLAQYGEFVLSLRYFWARGLGVGCLTAAATTTNPLDNYDSVGGAGEPCIGKRFFGGEKRNDNILEVCEPGNATFSIDQTNSPP